MAYETIRLETEGRIAHLTLHRPEKMNALNPEMLRELLDALTAVRRNQDLNVLVLGAAGRCFCAGVDLTGPFFMEQVESDSVFSGVNLLDWQHELITSLYELPQLTIATVTGDAVGGGGFGMAMACDIRYALRDARFWMIPMQVNVTQDFGLTWFLQRTIGMPRTMEMLFSARPYTGANGEAMGFVNRALPSPEAVRAAAEDLAATVAGAGPDAVRLAKWGVRHGAGADLRTQLHQEAIGNGLCFQSAEFRSAKAAYQQRLARKRSSGSEMG